MTTIQMLEDAIHERIAKENAFKESIIVHINKILSRLPICDTASPEVSNTVTLSREKLESILAKIKDYKSINQFAVKELVSKLNLDDIRRGSPISLSNEKHDYFSDPANVANAFRFANPPRESRFGAPYAVPGAAPIVTNEGQPNEEHTFGGKRTTSRRR